MFLRINKFLTDHALVICVITTLLLGTAYLPVGFVTIDEQNYFANTERILDQRLKQNCSGAADQFPVNDYCISKYNLGTSLFLIPAATTGFKGLALITSLAVFVVGILLFSRILKQWGLSQSWLYLFAFYPNLVFQSRTLLSEIYSTTLLVALLFFATKSKRNIKWLALAGLCAGLAIWVRYTNIIIIGTWFVLFFWNYRRNLFKRVTAFGLTFAPIIIVLFLNNLYLYGGIIRSGYFYSGEEGFTLQNLWVLVPYCVILNLIFPGMLVFAGLKLSKQKFNWFLPSIVSIVFYSFSRNTLFTWEPIDLFTGVRFLVPIMPWLLLSAISTWQGSRLYGLWKKYLWLWVVMLIMVTISLHIVHNNFVAERVATSDSFIVRISYAEPPH